MKMCRILLLVLALPLSGCLKFYEVNVNKPDKMMVLREPNGGTPISGYLFGCDKDINLYRDSANTIWLYCEGYYQRTYYKLAKVGPCADEKEYDSRSTSKATIDKMRNGMKTILLKPCKQATYCGPETGEPAMLRVLHERSDTYVEYLDFSIKKELYARVMNGEPLETLLAAGRTPALEKSLVPTICQNILQNSYADNNRKLLMLISGKSGADFDTYLGRLMTEIQAENAMTAAERASWFQTEEGCKLQLPALLNLKNRDAVKSLVWTGNCIDGKAEGTGTLKLTAGNYAELNGTMIRGAFEGKVKSDVRQYEGAFMGSGGTHYLHNNVSMNRNEYIDAQKHNSFDAIVQKKDSSMLDCASSFDIDCLGKVLGRGQDVDKKAESGVTPLFMAITSIRNEGHETSAGIATVKWLLEHGASTEYRVNPYPVAFRSEMNAREYLQVSRVEGVFNLRAPNASKTLALFSDPEVMAKNAQELEYSLRARGLGLPKNVFLKKLAKVDELRGAGTFEGYKEAFKLSGAKRDFVDAQKRAKTKAQKKSLEYLAILATRDKARIFEITTSLNNGAAQSVDDTSRSDQVLFVFNVKSKSSDTTFKGRSKIRIGKQSPIKIDGSYKVTVKYTLRVPLETVTTATFIFSNTSKRIETVERTVEKTFLVKPKGFTLPTNLDFGSVSIAGSASMLAGVGKVSKTIKEDPTLSAEIIRVEMAND